MQSNGDDLPIIEFEFPVGENEGEDEEIAKLQTNFINKRTLLTHHLRKISKEI